mmetsp:Transcript_64083/g.150400  ORF Transcript_64083/g.150400 Transcript_64083/m.150400 type:complete len:216 (-) Transcript_64083:326-973(-)
MQNFRTARPPSLHLRQVHYQSSGSHGQRCQEPAILRLLHGSCSPSQLCRARPGATHLATCLHLSHDRKASMRGSLCRGVLVDVLSFHAPRPPLPAAETCSTAQLEFVHPPRAPRWHPETTATSVLAKTAPTSAETIAPFEARLGTMALTGYHRPTPPGPGHLAPGRRFAAISCFPPLLQSPMTSNSLQTSQVCWHGSGEGKSPATHSSHRDASTS